MEYLLERPTPPVRFGTAIKIFFANIIDNRTLIKQIDGLQADYAIAMDQCQLMKQHIQDLESKISNMNVKVELRPDVRDVETPYSFAIVLAKKGCGKKEIIEECGLTESEADLILALHNRRADDSPSTIAVN